VGHGKGKAEREVRDGGEWEGSIELGKGEGGEALNINGVPRVNVTRCGPLVCHSTTPQWAADGTQVDNVSSVSYVLQA